MCSTDFVKYLQTGVLQVRLDNTSSSQRSQIPGELSSLPVGTVYKWQRCSVDVRCFNTQDSIPTSEGPRKNGDVTFQTVMGREIKSLL